MECVIKSNGKCAAAKSPIARGVTHTDKRLLLKYDFSSIEHKIIKS